MLTRGLIIGKIVDDLANLKYQIETRNRLGQFDLSKFCEDFFREILNITYDYNLQNLNRTRSNEPGLDLGDEKGGVAFQITSQKTSAKINETLSKITEKQQEVFSEIKVFIIGEKQSSYTLDNGLISKFSFNADLNIADIDTLLREVVLLDIEKLEILYNLFSREFRQVRIELEPLDENGNFESSYYNIVEKSPSKPANNGILFIGEPDKYYETQKEELDDLYKRLSAVPRVTREILSIIVEKGKYQPANDISNCYGIIPEALEKFMKLNKNELLIEINILESEDLVSFTEGTVGERQIHFLIIRGETLNYLCQWILKQKFSLRTLLNTMDFTILDK